MEDFEEYYFFLSGDLAKIGLCLTNSQKHKMVLAPGSLPKAVSVLIERIKDDIHGCSLAGAGGGGFLAVIAKTQNFRDKLSSIIQEVDSGFELYPVEMDLEGVSILCPQH
jgi:galactokinase/mevalonate kinase-like predicted kinase